MGYLEATEDSIPITRDSQGMNWYSIPCSICGSPVKSWSYQREKDYRCKYCRLLTGATKRAKKRIEGKPKRNRQMETAVKRIRKLRDAYSYASAIEWVRARIDDDVWFDSTEEIMVAIELRRRGIPFEYQKRFGLYRVDFLLPNQKIILEIDGELFHNQKRDIDRERDNRILEQLGKGWQSVRIPASDIDMNVSRLLPAIKALLAQRKKCSQKFSNSSPRIQ